MSKSQIQLDYEASFTPATASAGIATATLGTVLTGMWLSMPWWAAAVLGGVAATVNLIHHLTHRTKGTPHRVTGALVPIWLTWTAAAAGALTTHPDTWNGTGWWLALSLFLALWVCTHAALHEADIRDEAHFAEQLDNPDANQLSRIEYDRRRRKLADDWIDRIERATRIRPTVTALKEWPNSTGFSLEIDLPTGTRSDTFTAAACRQLAEDARLPVGCTVTVAPSTVQGHLIINVMLTDPATTTTPYPNPRQLSRITVNGGIPWGLNPMSEEITVELREACALILGPPGTGKTTLMDTILAGFARCDDVLVWGIDIAKEGDAFVHWCTDLTPGVNRGIDWVAATRDEAILMLDAAATIARTRLRTYRDLMARRNTKLLPISHDLPMIFLVIDEGAHILGSTAPEDQPLRARIIDIMETTRAMGVRLILTATDGNVSAIGDSRVRKYAAVRVALTATDTEGAAVQKLFGTIRGLDVRQLRAKGSGVIDPGYGPIQFRTWYTDPNMAKDVTAATTTYRPTLDTASHDAIADDYDTRWTRERTAWIHGEHATISTRPATGTTNEDGATGEEPTGGLTLNLKVRNPDGTTSRRTYPHDGGDAEDPTDELFADIIGNMEVADPRKPRPSLWDRAAEINQEWRRAALEILNAEPTTWWSTADLLDALTGRGITVARQTLATELASLARRGTIRSNGKGGAHTRYQGTGTVFPGGTWETE